MKVLITGATGFVGSCLTRRLVTLGQEVHLFTRKTSNRWRLRDLRGRVTEHDVDLRDPAAVASAVTAISPEVVCHLATYGGVSTQRDRTAILDVNFQGTVNLVRACERTGLKLFINTGSSSEYGIKSNPMRETDILEPLDEYGVAKAAATLYCSAVARTGNVPIVTLRLFSPYGPWDEPSRFIPSVIAGLLRGTSPRVSTPRSVRDYVYIDDAIDCYTGLIEHPSGFGEIFNIGSGEQRSIGEIAAILGSIIDPAIAPEWGAVDRQRAEPVCWVADPAKAAGLLGWSPRIPLQEGLAKTVGWFRDHLTLYP